MSEMIERVAEVIKRFWDLHATEPSTGFTPEELAKLVIFTMREPSKPMLDKVQYDIYDWGAENWRAMIDAALTASASSPKPTDKPA